MILVVSSHWEDVEERLPVMIDFLVMQKTELPGIAEKKPPVKSKIKSEAQPIAPEEEIIKQQEETVSVPEQAKKNTDTGKITPESENQNTKTNVSEDKKLINNQAKLEISTDEGLPDAVPFFKLTESPQFLHRETPVYPESMRASGRRGVVILSVFIDKTGKVRKVTVLESGGEQFDIAAIHGMQASSFIPAKIDGKAVAVILKMPVEFRLM